MKKTILKKAIAFSLVLAIIFATIISVQATSMSNTYSFEMNGIIYCLTEEYDETGTKFVTITGGGEIVMGSFDGETMIIETDGIILSTVFDYAFFETNFANEVTEIMNSVNGGIQIMSTGTSVSALGYSLNLYTHTSESNNVATLTTNMGTKSKTASSYSNNFYSNVMTMANYCYNSGYLAARLALIAAGHIVDKMTNTQISAALALLNLNSALGGGIKTWSNAESAAKSNYTAF